MIDRTCLHCKISAVIIDHFREKQALPPNTNPSLGSAECVELFAKLAEVVADCASSRSPQKTSESISAFGLLLSEAVNANRESDARESAVRH